MFAAVKSVVSVVMVPQPLDEFENEADPPVTDRADLHSNTSYFRLLGCGFVFFLK